MQNVRLTKLSSQNQPNCAYFSPAPPEYNNHTNRLDKVNRAELGSRENSMSTSMFYGSVPTGKFFEGAFSGIKEKCWNFKKKGDPEFNFRS